MTKNLLKRLISVAVICCILCNATAVFATGQRTAGIPDIDVGGGEEIVIPTTEEEKTEAQTTEKNEKPTEEEKTTEEKTTEAPDTTEKETQKKPAKETEKETQRETEKDTERETQTTGRDDDDRETRPRETQAVARPGSTTTTEEQLPEGSFYVYLELNNGTERLKTVLDKPGLVPEPNEPKREGYIFDGWFADEEYTLNWDFFSDFGEEGTVIYAKWVPDEGTIEYNIKVAPTKGGKLKVNPSKASKGEIVTITILPDEGKKLVAGSLLINGEPSDVFSFTMPKGTVTVSASFEDIPKTAIDENNGKDILSVVLIILAVIIVILVVAVIIIKRKANQDVKKESVLFDDDDDDDTVWIDGSIVVENAFKIAEEPKEDIDEDEDEDESDEAFIPSDDELSDD